MTAVLPWGKRWSRAHSSAKASASAAVPRQERCDMCLAVPGRVTAIHGEGEFRSARVDFSGVARQACLAFVPDVVVGDYVLVHVGFAIARIDEAAAEAALEALETLGVEDLVSEAGSRAPR